MCAGKMKITGWGVLFSSFPIKNANNILISYFVPLFSCLHILTCNVYYFTENISAQQHY